MKIACLLVSSLALAFVASAGADAFKCRTADGKTVISNAPCQSGSRTEAVQPNDEISPEQRRRAEQDLERQQRLLAEQESARAAQQLREQEARRKQAEEESQRLALCLQNARSEPDPQLRTDLVAACTGMPPPQPVAAQQQVYVPVAPFPSRRVKGSVTVCVSGDCKEPHPPRPKTETPVASSKPSACRQAGNSVRCD